MTLDKKSFTGNYNRVFNANERREWGERVRHDNEPHQKKLRRMQAFLGKGFCVPCELYSGQPAAWTRWFHQEQVGSDLVQLVEHLKI